jgi:hypothetical protein
LKLALGGHVFMARFPMVRQWVFVVTDGILLSRLKGR